MPRQCSQRLLLSTRAPTPEPRRPCWRRQYKLTACLRLARGSMPLCLAACPSGPPSASTHNDNGEAVHSFPSSLAPPFFNNSTLLFERRRSAWLPPTPRPERYWVHLLFEQRDFDQQHWGRLSAANPAGLQLHSRSHLQGGRPEEDRHSRSRTGLVLTMIRRPSRQTAAHTSTSSSQALTSRSGRGGSPVTDSPTAPITRLRLGFPTFPTAFHSSSFVKANLSSSRSPT